jgi:hypothetical protein
MSDIFNWTNIVIIHKLTRKLVLRAYWLEQWELEWDMEFNPSKCQVIHVAKRKHPIPSQYDLHGVQLESVILAKYLGLDISENLTWDAHIESGHRRKQTKP